MILKRDSVLIMIFIEIEEIAIKDNLSENLNASLFEPINFS